MDDTLEARDGAKDLVDGGTGRDRATFDKVDRLSSIEVRQGRVQAPLRGVGPRAEAWLLL